VSRAPIPTWYFALVVVRLGRRFLLVKEKKHGARWYLPGGRVEPGERIQEAARRETLEEAGIPIVLEGILRVEHSPLKEGTARCRVLFVARPENDAPPKSEPDNESLGAAWVTLEELERLPVRGVELRRILQDVACGAQIYPLSLLTTEGEPLLGGGA
jgi:8-oxo-dGTP pyrophosphatase MutT (NUDIX family)